jgi:hypothetical protein
MLIPIMDNITELNLHALYLKVDWIDLAFMPCKYFGTSLKTITWSIFDDIAIHPLPYQTRLDSMDHE